MIFYYTIADDLWQLDISESDSHLPMTDLFSHFNVHIFPYSTISSGTKGRILPAHARHPSR
jgi:hypothetical protein